MELVYFLIAAVVFLIAKGIYDSVRNKKKIREKIQREFGTLNDEDDFNLQLAEDSAVYFEEEKKISGDFSIDNITANDLALDYIYLLTDKTRSAAGSSVYFNILRTPCFDEKELYRREKLLNFFETNSEKRIDLQLALSSMSKKPGFHVHYILEAFRNNKFENPLIQYIHSILLLASVIYAIVVNTSASLLFPVIVIIYNIVSYYMAKSKIDRYMYGIKNIIGLIEAGNKILKVNAGEFDKENNELQKALSKLKSLKKASWAIKTTVSGDLASILLDYANLVFHFDLISLNKAIKCAAVENESIMVLYRNLGYIDAMINICSLRAFSKCFCIPELSKEGKPHLSFKGAYHLLLNDPVPADLDTDRNILITGSNASGKSTFLKTVALNAIFAQTIHTCFAESYKGSFFRVITGMSLSDNIIAGESYYITEIKSLKRIMDDESETPVLCFVDEVLRGTNTIERIAASTASLSYLAKQNKLVFAATHDIELTSLLKQDFSNYHFEENLNEEGDVCFDYMLKSGPSETRNAILMLKAYGYDTNIIESASALAEDFVKNGAWINPLEAKG
ncbi:MAG: hypothetical protein K6F63_02830 [Lachnospiraceae bacterium]|nr:hypothetical protein [Lachnospiraceae bacterium]